MKYSVKYTVLLVFFIVRITAVNSEELNFGYASGENIVSIINKFTPMMNYITTRTGMKVNFIRTISYAETQEGFINGVLDIGILNTLSFLEIEKKEVIIPVAERLKKGHNTYQSYFIVRKDSSITDLEDIKNKIFAFGDPNSTSSALIPQKILASENIDIYKDLKQFIYFQKQDSILYAILNKTVDMGAVASFIFEESDPEVKELLKVVKKSDPFPLGPFVVSRRMNEDLRNRITAVLLEMNTNEEGKTALHKADLEGFLPFNNRDFDPLRKLYRDQHK